MITTTGSITILAVVVIVVVIVVSIISLIIIVLLYRNDTVNKIGEHTDIIIKSYRYIIIIIIIGVPSWSLISTSLSSPSSTSLLS